MADLCIRSLGLQWVLPQGWCQTTFQPAWSWMNDQIFGMSVVAQHCLESRRDILTSDRVDDNARVLFHLLNCGLLDQEVMDRPRDGATRVMRYSTAMGEQLWRLINGNITQVGGLEAYSFDE